MNSICRACWPTKPMHARIKCTSVWKYTSSHFFCDKVLERDRWHTTIHTLTHLCQAFSLTGSLNVIVSGLVVHTKKHTWTHFCRAFSLTGSLNVIVSGLVLSGTNPGIDKMPLRTCVCMCVYVYMKCLGQILVLVRCLCAPVCVCVCMYICSVWDKFWY